ncbi:Flp family type IVb pilin [Devosia sp. XJ19-1]|uniref:Flp family type IVb pilin n=1 Tax=Devosia ureilytica TaxID=2952754 RepID=A0A9Q4FSF2_9HYPH|nr:Flp family type IVb pilin [Devosia ureilytica]MCP8882868.1 Flp family type IVb pilin [Devosia ureilytica]MCP8886764.1 Flp family type IVb pilin [Devosia ureilytica]
MVRRVLTHIRQQKLITLVEYGLIAAIITVATTFAVSAAGYNITDFFPG